MSPIHLRAVFVGFALLIAGVTTNVMLLQPARPTADAARAGGESKAERERRQRLALERTPGAVNSVVTPLSVKMASVGGAVDTVEPAKAAIVRADSSKAPAAAASTAASIPMEHGPRRFARLRLDAAHTSTVDKLPDAPDAEGDPDTIKAVQRELTTRGYGQLAPDGVPGLVTRAAIMAFEHDHRMALTGEATERVLSRLLLGPMGAANMAPDPAAGKVRSSQAELVMRTVQQSLAALGYQVGRIDGKPGDEIARAIREFELDENLKPTGRVSAEVFSRLGRVVASAKPKPIQ